jgi:hypothetical protein
MLIEITLNQNAVYDVKIDCKYLENYAKNQFYNTESDEFTTGNTTGSDGFDTKQSRAFITFKSDKVALSAGVQA